MALKSIGQVAKEARMAERIAQSSREARDRESGHARREQAHQREAEGVCPVCGGRTIDGSCIASCQQWEEREYRERY